MTTAQRKAAEKAAKAAEMAAAKKSLGSILAGSQSSSFPNESETYECKFEGFKPLVLADGREFTLLLVEATDSNDVTAHYSTIVQKTVDVPEELKEESFTIETEEQPDKKYCKVTILPD